MILLHPAQVLEKKIMVEVSESFSPSLILCDSTLPLRLWSSYKVDSLMNFQSLEQGGIELHVVA